MARIRNVDVEGKPGMLNLVDAPRSIRRQGEEFKLAGFHAVSATQESRIAEERATRDLERSASPGELAFLARITQNGRTAGWAAYVRRAQGFF